MIPAIAKGRADGSIEAILRSTHGLLVTGLAMGEYFELERGESWISRIKSWESEMIVTFSYAIFASHESWISGRELPRLGG